MNRSPRMKCRTCGCGNRFAVNKVFIEQSTSEPKVKVFIPSYEPLEIVGCKKCGKVLTQPKELIRIQKSSLT